MGHSRMRGLAQDLDSVEFFSGGQAGEAVTKGMLFFGLKAVGIEIQKNARFHDFTTAEGFAFSLSVVFRLTPGGICFLAPVCSNWIWLVRSVSGRCSAYPLGYYWIPEVEWSNSMVSRVVIILKIMKALGSPWVIEQPLSSVLYLHPRFQEFLNSGEVYRITLDMFQFGADTAKPTVLYASHAWIEEILQYMFDRPKAGKTLASRKWDANREKWVVTGGAEIKASQHYPIRFGRCLARVYNARRPEIRIAALAHLEALAVMPEPVPDVDDWADAHMQEVLEYARGLQA